MLRISPLVSIPEHEIELTAVRSQGAGGQNVNKVSTAIHLRFDIVGSSLPESYKARLLTLSDRRVTAAGVLIIKAQRHRSQDMNRDDALDKLRALVQSVATPRKPRTATAPTWGSKQRRLESKSQRGEIKSQRQRPSSRGDLE